MNFLVLWPTSACNLHCRYCYAATVAPQAMEPIIAEQALQRVGAKPFKLQLAGGEPLLNLPLVKKVLNSVMTMPQCKGVSIQTNATLIDDGVARLLRNHAVAVGVSLDGSVDVNERQRGGTRETVLGIQTLARHGVHANITCVVTAANARQLADVADLAFYFGNIRGIGLDLLRAAGRADKGTSPETSPADPSDLIYGLNTLCARLEQLNELLPPERHITLREAVKASIQLKRATADDPYCYASQGKSIVVLPDGSCYPCGSLAGNPLYKMGNVTTGVHSIKICADLGTYCAGCDYRAICTGICPSRSMLVNGFSELDCTLKKYFFQRIQNDTLHKASTTQI